MNPAFLRFGFSTQNIVKILADQYPTLLSVIREAVQNAIDAAATRIVITLNLKDREVEICDNGKGASFAEIEHKFLEIGHSTKKGAYGMFGVALLSPIGKCDQVDFYSRTKGDKEFYQLRIDVKEFARALGEPSIKVKPTTYDPLKEWWTTKVAMHRVKDDRTCRFPTALEIEDEVVSNFNAGMERLKTDVTVHLINEKGAANKAYSFKARPYGGEPLAEIEIIDNSRKGSKALFRLFKVPSHHGGRGVSVGNRSNLSRISWAVFVRSMSQDQLSADLTKALSQGTGLFEGEILTSAIEFLNVDRQSVKLSDQLLEFLVAIEKWWETIGQEIYESAVEEGKDLVYQKSMLDVLTDVQRIILADPDIRQALHQELTLLMQLGTVGEHHARIARKDEIGHQPQTSISTQGGPNRPKSDTFAGHEQSSRPQGRTGDLNTSAKGPLGRQRRIVRSEGIGFQMEVATMMGSSHAYEFDPKSALIQINSRHPAFASCEAKSDRVLKQYMALIVQDVIIRIITKSLDDNKYSHMLDLRRDMAVNSLLKSPLFNQGALISQAWEEKKREKRMPKKK